MDAVRSDLPNMNIKIHENRSSRFGGPQFRTRHENFIC